MQLFFKVTIEYPAVGGIQEMRRSFCFKTKEEAGAFIGEMRNRNINVVGTSIDHIMTGAEAAAEVAEELDLTMRAAYSEAR